MRLPHTQRFESEDSGSLMSISDMMAALLFVFIITLVAFIINFQDATDKRDKAYDAVTGIKTARDKLLEDIQKQLEERGVLVTVDFDHGILRLKEDAIRFHVGSAQLDDLYKTNLEIVGSVLASVLPCYTKLSVNEREFHHCDESSPMLDSILIEGHTDNVPISNRVFGSNWELSTQRAIETYKVLEKRNPETLMELKNRLEEKIFSVSGYGENRPINDHGLMPTPDSENRRIDFRFIMAPPQVVEPQAKAIDAGIS